MVNRTENYKFGIILNLNSRIIEFKCEEVYSILSILGDKCIIPPLTPPPPEPDPTIPPEIKVIVVATEKTSSTLLILCLILTLFIFCFIRVYTITRVIQMNMEISLILANIFAVVIPNLSEYTQVHPFDGHNMI